MSIDLLGLLVTGGDEHLYGPTARWDRSLDDSVESLGSERGIITKVEVNVALERAIGVERGPVAAVHIVALVGAWPREFNARPAITIRVAAVEYPDHGSDEEQQQQQQQQQQQPFGLEAVNRRLAALGSGRS